jgi:hypothetical protein
MSRRRAKRPGTGQPEQVIAMSDVSRLQNYLDEFEEIKQLQNELDDRLRRTRYSFVTDCFDAEITLGEAVEIYKSLTDASQGSIIRDFCEAINIQRPLLKYLSQLNETDDRIRSFEREKIDRNGKVMWQYNGSFPLEYQWLPREGKRCLYFLWAETTLLYIGQSSNVKNRLKSHGDKKKYGLSHYIILELWDSVDILDLERQFIIDMKPLLNIEHNEAMR